jgi:hypothetical protein
MTARYAFTLQGAERPHVLALTNGPRATMRRASALLVAVAASVAVVACGSEDSTTTSATAKSIGFHPNRKVYDLPLDQLRSIDDGSVGYATNLLVQDCMQAAGFEFPIPPFDPSLRPSATWNSTGRRLFDPEVAAQYGYRIAPPPGVDVAQEIALNSRPLSSAEQRQVDRCRVLAGQRIAPPDSRLVDSLGIAAYDAALSEADTVAAARRWAACLEPQGISDLPDMPNLMPSPSIVKRFHIGRGGGSASPEEIQIAVADARCRESSGYAKALYDNEVDQQLALFAKNRAALERARAAAKRNLKRARAVIAQHGS